MAIEASMGHQGFCSINGTSMAFLSSTLAKHGTILARGGIRGTRSHDVDGTRAGPYTVSGAIRLQPSPTELLALLNLAIGGSDVVAETLTEFDVVVDKDANIWTYADCKVNRCVVVGNAGGIIECTLDLIGKTEADAGTVSEPASAAPYIMSDLTLTLLAASRKTQSFELTIDNALVADRFLDNLTVQDTPEGDRIVGLNTVHDYNATNADLYDQALAGAAGTLVLNDGTTTTTITFGKLQVPAESPVINDKGVIPLNLAMTARKDGATKEIALAQAP